MSAHLIRLLFCSAGWVLSTLAFSSGVFAHDFWIEPSAFHVRTGEQFSLRLLMGDPDAVEHWDLEWRRVVSLQDFGPRGVRDLTKALKPLEGAASTMERPDAAVGVTETGTHMIAFVSNQSLNDLPAKEFNAYAEHEGLALPLAQRRKNGTTGEHGRELYSRRAKALIQVGDQRTRNVTHPIGQTLEIVPQSNPLTLNRDDSLELKILLHGSVLPGASVVLEKLGNGATHGTPVISDRAGRVSFPFPGPGAWKINVVWSYPIVDPRAEYETIFCSLTFGS